jgi:hypothetical protein
MRIRRLVLPGTVKRCHCHRPTGRSRAELVGKAAEPSDHGGGRVRNDGFQEGSRTARHFEQIGDGPAAAATGRQHDLQRRIVNLLHKLFGRKQPHVNQQCNGHRTAGKDGITADGPRRPGGFVVVRWKNGVDFYFAPSNIPPVATNDLSESGISFLLQNRRRQCVRANMHPTIPQQEPFRIFELGGS